MLTYNRYINLLVFYHLCNNWMYNDLNYIMSKYKLLFLQPPDEISLYNLNHYIDFQNKLYEYKRIWKIKYLTEEQIKMLFHCYKMNTTNEKESSTFGRESTSLKYHSFSYFINCYNICFKSYNTIFDKNMTMLLHDVLKNDINEFLNISHNNERIKNIYFIEKLSKLKKNV